MDDKMKKTSERFPLRLPVEMDAEIRKLARGDGTHPPAGINETILFLIREGLKSIKSETKPGPLMPAQPAAAVTA
jgi:hypothetical protein